MELFALSCTAKRSILLIIRYCEEMPPELLAERYQLSAEMLCNTYCSSIGVAGRMNCTLKGPFEFFLLVPSKEAPFAPWPDFTKTLTIAKDSLPKS